MASRGPRAVEVVLSVQERAELARWADGAAPAAAGLAVQGEQVQTRSSQRARLR
jgi:hypothetical protein